MPAARSRAERFDDAVLEVVEALERRWEQQLRGVEYAVEDVPPSDPSPWEHGVPLGRYFAADPVAGLTHRIVLYRRVVEERVEDAEMLRALVREVVVEQVAQLLGRTPEEVDPGYRGD
jgi:predicted Zn-dependent protease with MMP-like domain